MARKIIGIKVCYYLINKNILHNKMHFGEAVTYSRPSLSIC